MENEVKKRGRPRLVLTPDEVEERKQKRRDYQKRSGYAPQQKYKKNHNELYKNYSKLFYFPKIYIKKENKNAINNACSASGMTLTDFFINALEQVYGLKIKK